jgi:hypothetical protein
MATRAPRRHSPDLFILMERQVVGLYDAGVLSPAVLQHVISAYADSAIDWTSKGTLHTADRHDVFETVVLVMMPGRSLRSAQTDFMSVVQHIAGAREHAPDEENDSDTEDDETLLKQLGDGKRADTAKKRNSASPKERPGFNPLVGARAVGKR